MKKVIFLTMMFCNMFLIAKSDDGFPGGGCAGDEICSDEPTPLDDEVGVLVGAGILYGIYTIRKNARTISVE